MYYFGYSSLGAMVWFALTLQTPIHYHYHLVLAFP